MTRYRHLACWLAVLPCCGAAPSGAEHVADDNDVTDMVTALVEFADAASFVPAGMQSTSFTFDDSCGYRVRLVRAGSSFRRPPVGHGVGPCDLVEVTDTEGADPECREFFLQAEGAGAMAIGDQTVTHAPSSHEGQFHDERWRAIVANRFEVVASSRALLERALSRTSSVAALIAGYGNLPPIPRQFQAVVLCHSRQSEQGPYACPMPAGDMVFVTSPDRLALHMFAAAAPRSAYWQYFDGLGIKDTRPVFATRGSWCEHVGRFAPGTSTDQERVTMLLVQWQLFGFVVVL